MTQFKKTREQPIDPDAPWDDDVFKTLQGYATFLTNALIADPGPFVLNVNGAWGSGKTFFVKRWAADLRKQGYPVVEFNAWENDSSDDPLAPLMACFLDAQREIIPEDAANKFKQTCGKYILAGGGLIVRAGLKQLLGEKGIEGVKDLLSDEAEGELIELAGQHVDEQLAKQKAARNLEALLEAFAQKVEESDDWKLPVFIFIDELDRCRPTFAIELLERVKHLFNVDGIKFVVSTDSTQLVHSISGAYGVNFDGATYLQRFFDETFTLPEPSYERFSKMLFAPVRESIEDLDDLWVAHKSPEETFSTLSKCIRLSLRQQKLAFQRLLAISANCSVSDQRAFHFLYACFLVFLKVKNDQRYGALIQTNDEHKSLTIRSSGKNLLNEIVGQYSFPQAYAKYLATYIEFSEGDHDNAMKVANAERPEGPRIPGSKSEEQMVNSWIIRDCISNFASLKLYPKLVELTASITTS